MAYVKKDGSGNIIEMYANPQPDQPGLEFIAGSVEDNISLMPATFLASGVTDVILKNTNPAITGKVRISLDATNQPAFEPV